MSKPDETGETVHFTAVSVAGKPDLLADAEVHFGAGSRFAGLKLTGFQVRRSKYQDAGQHVTFPAVAFGFGQEKRYFDLLRPVASMGSVSGKDAVTRIKAWVAEEYRAWKQSAADTEQVVKR